MFLLVDWVNSFFYIILKRFFLDLNKGVNLNWSRAANTQQFLAQKLIFFFNLMVGELSIFPNVCQPFKRKFITSSEAELNSGKLQQNSYLKWQMTRMNNNWVRQGVQWSGKSGRRMLVRGSHGKSGKFLNSSQFISSVRVLTSYTTNVDRNIYSYIHS